LRTASFPIPDDASFSPPSIPPFSPLISPSFPSLPSPPTPPPSPSLLPLLPFLPQSLLVLLLIILELLSITSPLPVSFKAGWGFPPPLIDANRSAKKLGALALELVSDWAKGEGRVGPEFGYGFGCGETNVEDNVVGWISRSRVTFASFSFFCCCFNHSLRSFFSRFSSAFRSTSRRFASFFASFLATFSASSILFKDEKSEGLLPLGK